MLMVVLMVMVVLMMMIVFNRREPVFHAFEFETVPVQNIGRCNAGPVGPGDRCKRIKPAQMPFDRIDCVTGVVDLVQHQMIAEGDLVGGILPVFQLTGDVDRVDDAQYGVQSALRADYLVDHHGLDDRTGIGEPRRFDDDPVEIGLFAKQSPHRADQIAPHHAADTAAVQLDQFLVARIDQIAVDPDITKFVDDDGV